MRIIKDKLIAFFSAHLIHYSTPLNLTYVWSLGAMAGFCLVIQIVSGLFLAMHYIPDADTAFLSVNDGIMQNVKYGWLFRYVHANGASLFFIVVYGHIFKALYYGSYCKPRHLMYFAGIIIFILMMATAFIGYVLPWGQMSLWGATVITNLFSAIPFIGDDLVRWLWGGYGVGAPTLVRFAALHFFLPYIIAAVVGVHLVLLHTEGSSNPLGTNNVSLTSFYPSFGIKDLLSAMILLFVLAYLVTFEPNLLGHADNYIPANPLVTPAHIVPEWYFLPFYAILRSIPNKLGGVLAMFAALLILFILPFVNTSNIRSAFFRPFYSFFLILLMVDVLLLGWIGSLPVEEPFVTWGAYLTIYYFTFFIVIVPVSGKIESFFIKNFIFGL